MPDDLGGRLLRAGLVTRDQLADALSTAPLHEGALVAALAARGVPEEAIAGFFLTEGFGPLMEPEDLAAADPAAVRRLPPAMARDLLTMPVRSSPAGLVVAMAAPSDRHALRELSRAVGSDVLPTVACVGVLARALDTLAPAPSTPAKAAPATDDPDGEPILGLTRRRSSPDVAEDGTVGADERPRRATDPAPGNLGPRLVADDDEPALLLVRTKPQRTPAGGVDVSTLPKPKAPRVVSKSFGRPDGLRKPQRPGIPVERPSAVPPLGERRGTATYAALPETSLDAPSSAAEAPATQASTPPPRPPSVAKEPTPTSSVPPRSTPELVVEALGALPAVPSSEPASSRSTPPRRTASVPIEHERWDAEDTSEEASRSTPFPPAPSRASRSSATEIGTVLSAMRTATERDEVVRLACEGALTVGRAVVFLALRKDVLKGWDAAGSGLSRDAARNLWIPTTSPSSFRHVLEEQVAHVGPYGTSIADGLFRAAVGSRGGDAMLQPVVVAEKVVGMLCVDDLAAGPVARQRIEVLAHAVGEAFRRLLTQRR